MKMKKILILSAFTVLFSSVQASEHFHIESHQDDQGKGWEFAGKIWDSFCEGTRQVSQAMEHVVESAVDTFAKDRPETMKNTGFFADWKENTKKG